MFKGFKELHSYYTGESFNTYISDDNLLMIQKPSFNKEFDWELLPNTNEAKTINHFYTIFDKKPMGDVLKIRDSVDLFYNKFQNNG